MALFVDGPASTIEDLTGFDSQLLDVASTERIDVTRKLTLAHEEITVDLQALLSRTASQSNSASLGSVVTTPALKLWHAYRTLEMIYGDAFNSQLNDRYAGRRDQFRTMAKWAREKLIETGLGMSAAPVPQASAPELTPISGSLPGGTYYITVAYVNGSGEEGRYAPPSLLTSDSGGFAARLSVIPASISGWNLYAGSGPEEMTLQNPQALAPSQQWLQPHALATGGRRPSEGQTPMTVRAVARVLLRG